MAGLWLPICTAVALAMTVLVEVTAESLADSRDSPRAGGVAASDVAGVIPPPPPPRDEDSGARKLLEQDLPSTRSLQQFGYGYLDTGYSTSYSSREDDTVGGAPPVKKRSRVDDSTETDGGGDLDDVFALSPLPYASIRHAYGDYGGYASAGSYSVDYATFADPPSDDSDGIAPAPGRDLDEGDTEPGSDTPIPLALGSTTFAAANDLELQLAADIVADQLALVINGRQPSREVTAAVFIISKQLLSPTSLLPAPEVIISALVEALKTRIERGSDATLYGSKSPVKTTFCFADSCISGIPVSVKPIISTP